MFILNTEYEGFSHLLVECMQLSLPVITTNVGGNPELVQHDMSGYLVEYNNKQEIHHAIVKLLEDEHLRNRYVAEAKKRLQEFSKEKSVQRVRAVLEDVINNRT